MIDPHTIPPRDLTPEEYQHWRSVLLAMPRLTFLVFRMVYIRKLGIFRTARRLRLSERRVRHHFHKSIAHIARNRLETD